MPSEKKLHTLAEWNEMTPRSQGYVLYMESEWPGSELKGIKNPYAKGSMEDIMFRDGETRGVLAAQDSEE
jgi:hypothetical protein